MDDFIQRYLPLLKIHALPILIGVAGLMFFGYGLMGLGEKKTEKQDILFEAASDTVIAEKVTPAKKDIVVDVEGAVIKPGVYTLQEDSRLQDALIAAGGMSEEADREQVAKNLNLASKIVDGAKIYIPWQGEVLEDSDQSSGASIVLGDSAGAIININTASQSVLEELPGIGEVTAQKIITSRPYSSIDELLEKKVVGNSVFEKIREKISI